MTGKPVPLRVDVQIATAPTDLPTRLLLRAWAAAACGKAGEGAELTVRFVGEAECKRLNRAFRGVDRATNVLSFPFEMPEGLGNTPRLLGDIVVCVPVVEREAQAQGKRREAHFAHMVVHGALHLLGLDHREDDEALIMEAHETEILVQLGYPDPYCVVDES